MRYGKFDLGRLSRSDGLERTRGVHDVFGLIGRIEAFRARPGMRDRGDTLDEAYSGLKAALLKPEESDCPHLRDPSPYLTDQFKAEAADRHTYEFKASAHGREGYLKPRLLLHARINQSGNLCLTVTMRHIDKDGRWQKAGEWVGSPNDIYFWGERPEDEVLYVKGVGDLVYWPGRYARQPDRDQERLSLATQAVVAAYDSVVKRLSARFDVQEDVHLTGIRSHVSDGGKWLGVEIVRGLDEHRASYAAALADFRRETGLSPVAFWHMFGTADADTEAASVSRRLRSRMGANAGMTPGVVRHWRDRLDRAARYGHWEVPPPTDEQVAALAHLEHHRAALAAPNAPGGIASGQARRTTPVAPGRLPDDVRAELGIEDVGSLVILLNEARAANGLRPMPQGDYPSNKANLARAVRALREFRGGTGTPPAP